MLCGILNVGLLLAWVRIDDTIRADLHVKDTLDLALQKQHHLNLAHICCYSWDFNKVCSVFVVGFQAIKLQAYSSDSKCNCLKS